MLFRLPFAWFIGAIICFLTVVIEEYDGVMTMIFAPIVSLTASGLTTLGTAIVGAPLYLKRVWPVWSRYWMVSVVGIAVAMCCLLLAWWPSLQESHAGVGDDLGLTFMGPNSTLSIVGWFLLHYCLVHCPRLGISKEKVYW